MKINCCFIVFFISESTCHAFHFFDLCVDAFSQCVGDPMTSVGYNIVDMSFERFGCFHNWCETGMSCPPIPLIKKPTHPFLVSVLPQMPQGLLDRPGTAYLEVLRTKALKFVPAILGYIFMAPQPKVLCAFQRIVTLFMQRLMLLLAYLVNRVNDVTHDMKPVKDDLLIRSRNIRNGRRDIGIPHINRHRFNPRAFLVAEHAVIRFQTVLFAIISYILNRAAVQIIYQ